MPTSLVVASVVLFAWHPQRLQQLGSSSPTPRAVVRANAAAQKAAELLGKMGMDSISGLKPGEEIETKEFVSAVKIRHFRTIAAVAGGDVADYMSLPVDQYAIYDPRLMRRLPESQGGDSEGDVFELSIPSMRPQPGTFIPKPKLRVRVTPGRDQISLESLSASLFGGDATALPPNVTADQMAAANARLGDFFGLTFNTTLAWAPSSKRGQPANATDLACRTDVRLAIQLPAPFTKAPRPLVQGAIGVIMRFVGNAILPRFASLLEADYARWCNGTRDMRGMGEKLVLDDDGYIVVPAEVLAKMKDAPGGAERLAAANAQLDLEGSSSSSVTPDEEI